MKRPVKPSKTAAEQPPRTGPLAAICAAGERLAAHASLPVDRGAFVSRYYEQDTEDLAGDPATLAAAALDHLRFGLERAPRTAKLRVFNPTLERNGWVSEHTIVQAVNDDMPFLVDSLSMTLTSMGHAIHVTIHPILQVERSPRGKLTGVRYAKDAGGGAAKAESFIHIEIVRETDPQLLTAIERALANVLRDVRAAVEDWRPMLERLATATAELRATKDLAEESKLESCEFLEWLADDRFTLLGYREYELTQGGAFDTLAPRAGTGLGVLRDDPVDDESVRLAGRARDEARSASPIVVTKSSVRSTVHRPAPLDHVGVKVFDAHGRPYLERRFLGLLTSTAYNESARDIPLLRLKARRVLEQSGLDPRGHRGKALQHILDTLPRDDLLQASLEDLRAISHGVLGLQERRKLKLFCRRETFGRFYSCLVYLPRDQYSERARRTIENVLLTGLRGNAVESEVAISEAALARLAVTVRTTPGDLEEPDVNVIQKELENAVRSWHDRLRDALLAELPEDRALELFHRYGEHFSAAYQEEADAARGLHDALKLAQLDDGGSDLEIALVRPRAEQPERLRLTTFRRGEPIPLYVALPVLENFGFKVTSERVYTLPVAGEPKIQDFEIETADKRPLDVSSVDVRFEQCFALVLAGRVDNDGFNSFVVSAGLDWRQAALLRAFCKYLLQTRSRYSQAYMQETLGRYPAYCRALVDKFTGLFDVDAPEKTRAERVTASDEVLKRELDRAASLDDDRILRSFGAVVGAVVRTNYYQTADGTPNGAAKSYVSFKLDSSALPFLPKPRPKFEIFVYSQRVEGVHLRSSKVARGGIRWSDRREDFRTEVLGLMKAQQVKNTVIVPSGAKGGFVCKSLPTAMDGGSAANAGRNLRPAGDRDAIQREVVACYQTFIRGLLDITDNIVDDAVAPPQRVLRKDDDDPYLVVAADKGTATFSDIANALSAEYGFWLGDAFASGGSAGYDHKEMGITARGAWESVRRHFLGLAINPDKDPFTVVGIGDMSGDVFGNGMLQSQTIELVGAFDHRHVFLDPKPDPTASFVERRRLYELPRSSWDDFDRLVISPGGGVWPRTAKSIPLSPEARELLCTEATALTPAEVISALLKAPVDLLFNGGIGTYVKASTESNSEVGDRANDSLRVN
ncbi:MAG TPA: NAD-glutamate dehydrogenase domain-containing protein, partial [Gammaproteobacteria bacterium]|nr:NAD-glutamate dehydrogenase domain-containing protein [Gammaproteobacteria bacterium]